MASRSCRKMAEVRVGAEWTCTTSGMVPRRCRVRSIDMTGVIPLPPVQNRIFAGGGSGSTNSPWGKRQPHDRSRLEAADQMLGQEPFGHRLDRDGQCARAPAAGVVGAELIEYERQCQFPPSCTPMPTYWPAW